MATKEEKKDHNHHKDSNDQDHNHDHEDKNESVTTFSIPELTPLEHDMEVRVNSRVEAFDFQIYFYFYFNSSFSSFFLNKKNQILDLTMSRVNCISGIDHLVNLKVLFSNF